MAAKKINPTTFESSLLELQEILKKLENTQVDLEEHLNLYGQGVKLIANCQEFLRTAEQRIAKLTGVDGEGKAHLDRFSHKSTGVDEAQNEEDSN